MKHLFFLFALSLSLSLNAQSSSLNFDGDVMHYIVGSDTVMTTSVHDFTYSYNPKSARIYLSQGKSIFYRGTIADLSVDGISSTRAKLQHLANKMETDPFKKYVAENIFISYGDVVSISAKGKTLLKFGQNKSVGTTEETIMQLQGSETGETYVDDNLITGLSSSDAGNTQNVIIEGHTIDTLGDLTFAIQSATLNGQNLVLLSTPLARVSRIYNNDSIDLVAASTVFVYDTTGVTLASGVPDDDSKVHIVMTASENQSLKASTSFSSTDYGILRYVYGTIDKQQAARADIRMKIREKGKVFRNVFKRSLDSSSKSDFDFEIDPFIVAPPNSDVIMTAEASTGGVSISGGMYFVLAKKIN